MADSTARPAVRPATTTQDPFVSFPEDFLFSQVYWKNFDTLFHELEKEFEI
jgi:hypothetical protein